MSPANGRGGVVVTDPVFDASRLRELRTAAGLSQSALGYKSGLSVTTVSRLENAANTPSLATVQVLARALGVKVDELMHPDGKGRRKR